MRVKLLLLLLVAGGAAFGAVTVARGWLEDRRAELLALQTSTPVQVETIDTVEVLVAREDLPSGTFLHIDQFVWTPFPSENLPETYLTRATMGEEGLTGAVIRGAITSGEPLTVGRVIRPGDRGFLAAVLRPGLRAVSVPVDATTGIAGFVFPGDRVDLLLTHEVELSQRMKRLATETVLTDIRVLAVDQRTDDTEGEPTLAKTATLEVDSKAAEVIAVALRMGRLSLALRSLAQDSDALATATPSPDAQTYTWDSQASRLLPPISAPAQPVRSAPARPAPPKVTVTVIRRGETETVEFRDTGS
ncbi:MAG: Flp pilus assembly protein CpaB [Alphaproteobacteria bacterium]|nr:Flp pilus assembly protein CpaB [Alphaproteobacteria bacterium]